MTDIPQLCPKCSGTMEQGFVLDAGHLNTFNISTWVPGAPCRSAWRGIQLPVDQILPIGTFRCSSCGYLESYARAEYGLKVGVVARVLATPLSKLFRKRIPKETVAR